MNKLITFQTHDMGYCFAEALQISSRGGAGLTKVAGAVHPEIAAYLRNLKSDLRYQYVLMTPLGSFEYWGMNVNGDIFPEISLSFDKSNSASDPLVVAKALEARWLAPFGGKIPPGNYREFGYRTFVGAQRYRHHQNKNPELSYGEITISVWNPQMHRVELVVRHDREKARQLGAYEIIQDLDDGKTRQISMGCFLSGTLVTMADGTRKPIEDVRVDDYVVTHLGRVRRVTETHRRSYVGKIYPVRAEAHETIYATAEHPWWALDEGQVKHRGRWKNTYARITPEWVTSAELSEHYLLEPVFDETLTPDYATEAFCRLLGYYLAEGHVLRNKNKEICGVEFTTHRDDYIHREIDALCAAVGTRNPPHTFERTNSDKALGVQIFDEKLAQTLYRLGGSYAKGKRMHPEVLRYHPDLQRHILGAYANGDGTALGTGALSLSTASTDLAWQWAFMLPRLGIIPSIQNLEHKAKSGFSRTVTHEWVIYLGKQFAQKLQDVCQKVLDRPVQLEKHARKIVDGYVVTPIRELTPLQVDTHVFNLEVEEDNSYLVGGLAVHNCRVPFDVCTACGKISKTPNDYCDCLRLSMGTVRADGTIRGAVNFFPNFFELSDVIVPAAKESGVLRKVASRRLWTPDEAHTQFLYVSIDSLPEPSSGKVKLASTKEAANKTADITKTVLPNTPDAKLEQITAAEPNLPDSLLRTSNLSRMLTTLAMLGIVLKPEEFQYSLLNSMGRGNEAETLRRSGCVFTPGPVCPGEFLEDDFSPSLASAVSPLLPGRSGFLPHLPTRIVRITIQAPVGAGAEPPPELKDLLKTAADVYASYRFAIGDMGTKLASVVERNLPLYRAHFFSPKLEKLASKKDVLYSALVPLYFKEAHVSDTRNIPDLVIPAGSVAGLLVRGQ